MTDSSIPENQDSLLMYQGDEISYEQIYRLKNLELIDSCDLTQIVSAVLSEILRHTDKLPRTNAPAFQMKYVPCINISTYLSRTLEAFRCSQECLIVAMIYVDRLTKNKPRFYIQSSNIHRLMMTAIMLATKFLDDSCYKNSHYAQKAEISLKELNILEEEFIAAINYNLYVNPNLFFKYREQLLSQGKLLLTKRSL